MTLVHRTFMGRGSTRASRSAIFLVAVLLTATLAACGRKGNLESPVEGSLYPRQYPAPEPYPSPKEPEGQPDEQ